MAELDAVWCAVQVATTATFAACGLEALRMLLADLEQPGGTLVNPVQAPMHLLLPIALKLVPTVLPAGAVGEQCQFALVPMLSILWYAAFAVFALHLWASCTPVHV